MVYFLRKKHPSSQAAGSSSKEGGKKNQLVHAVSPFDECLPTDDSSYFKRGFKTIRRKHSSQKEQLAKLKAKEILKSTASPMEVSDHDPKIEGHLLTGLLPAPARSKPTFSSYHNLSKPTLLRHQGKTREHNLSTATMMKTKGKTASMARSSGGREKYLTPLFRPTNCNDNLSPMTGGICDSIPTTGDHEIPFVISVARVDNREEDSSSDISLEDPDLPTVTATSLTSLVPTIATNAKPPYSGRLASPACTPPPADLDLQYSGSSISWPSDEGEDDEEIRDEATQDGFDRSTLQLITEVRELDCSDEDVGSQTVKTDIGCVDCVKVWSVGMSDKRNMKYGFNGSEKASSNSAANPASARDEENCRDDRSTDKTREDIFHRLESF